MIFSRTVLTEHGAKLCWEEENEVSVDGDDWMERLEERKDGRGGGSGGAMGFMANDGGFTIA
ncbi:hypothetical protein TSUD_76950 [Trifolium subterraneum]|uniref:Uncharacterized protein n=1 Tax=Trifolium subterraneum TaxID=3900 RepID=A0A2Z6LSN5_TRISU|nr:hypothetical protein TSUD_76950 [Trifolium subterraneum]